MTRLNDSESAEDDSGGLAGMLSEPPPGPSRVNFFNGWNQATELYQKGMGYDLLEYQRKVIEWAGPFVWNKSRQIGATTTIAQIVVFQAVMYGWAVNIFSNQEEQATFILNEYCMRFTTSLATILGHAMPKVMEKRYNFIKWDNGGSIRALAANPHSIRGFPARLIVLDEFAHFGREASLDQKMFQGAVPATSNYGGYTIVISTPFGSNNEFARICERIRDAEKRGELLEVEGVKIKGFTTPWTECPYLVPNIRMEKVGGTTSWYIKGAPRPMDDAEFRSEYNCEFLGQVRSAFPHEDLFAEDTRMSDAEIWHVEGVD